MSQNKKISSQGDKMFGSSDGFQEQTVVVVDVSKFSPEEFEKTVKLANVINGTKNAGTSLRMSEGMSEEVLYASLNDTANVIQTDFGCYVASSADNSHYHAYKRAKSLNKIKHQVAKDTVRARLLNKLHERQAEKAKANVWTVEKPFGFNEKE
jgi:hypothetical protein